MKKISVVVLAKNEKDELENCLKSVSFASEIIIIGDNLGNETKLIARKYNAKIYKRALNSDFAAQRNFGMEKTTGNWVLFVDADEAVSLALKEEILKEIQPS